MPKRMMIPALPLVLLLVCGAASHAYPSNSLGLGYVAENLFGLNYELAVSNWFGVNALAATSGEIDVVGMRLMLSRAEPSLQVRPSLGLCMVRGEYDEENEEEEDESPWFGFVWPGLGLNYRFAGRFSAVADISAIYGDTGEGDEVYGVLSAALMYMF